MRSHLILLVIPIWLASATSIAVDCRGCEQTQPPIRPESGVWHSFENDNVLIQLIVQGEAVKGFLLDQAIGSEARWLAFSSELSTGDPDFMWILSADLQQWNRNGDLVCSSGVDPSRLGCSSIEINFSQRNFAHYTIDDGSSVAIRPITFGSNETIPFEGSEVWFADMQGQWVVAHYGGGFNPFSDGISRVFRFGPVQYRQSANRESIGHLIYWPGESPSELAGQLWCSRRKLADGTFGLPTCRIKYRYSRYGQTSFDSLIPITNLGSSRFLIGIDDTYPRYVEGFRLDYD